VPEPLLLALSTAAIAAALVLLVLAERVDRARRAAPPLASGDAPAAGEAVTALLPVRDEERNVEACLAGLLRQPGLRVRVIDDASRDATRALAAAVAAREPRVEIVDAPPPPPGWGGKVHALEVGLAGAASEWVLLTDADTRHAAGLLAAALATARRQELAALSIAGRQETGGPGELLLVPAVFALLDALLGDWRRAAAGEAGIANGQFILARREALRRAGLFAAVRAEPLDDVALARRLLAHGLRCGFYRDQERLRIRMYRGLAETWAGWRRNLGLLLAPRPRRAALALLGVAGPPLLLLGALAAGAWPAAAAALLLGAGASALLRSGGRHSPWGGLLYPWDALALSALLVLALDGVRRGRLPPWKGRAVVPPRPPSPMP
jgi:cellulose synthase/poly-beta-1,6-N-acetylglucosamine synthase-like glycosyltransferase